MMLIFILEHIVVFMIIMEVVKALTGRMKFLALLVLHKIIMLISLVVLKKQNT